MKNHLKLAIIDLFQLWSSLSVCTDEMSRTWITLRHVSYTQALDQRQVSGRDTKGMIHNIISKENWLHSKTEESKNELERLTNAAESLLRN